MASQSRYIAERIDLPLDAVYAFASDPANLPRWAAGLGQSIEQTDSGWFADGAMGRIRIELAEPNPYGVLDHAVTLPTGEVVHNPMRVMPDGDGCELVFTLRRQPGVSDQEFDRDADAVAADLATLKQLLEAS